ncbi:flavodoxin [gamma proteobacterium HTCC5015]|nr:flavodoxin [gamma proteobacterium HTCC5015]
MIKIGLFYGSDEGATRYCAGLIKDQFPEGQIDVHDIADADPADFGEYEFMILGIPTWDFGELQSDWEEFWEKLEGIDFSGKICALFGLGDQRGYGDYYLDAMGMLNDVIEGNGAIVIGNWPIDSYDFEASKALMDNGTHFVGLGLDEDQQEELTNERIEKWTAQIKEEMGLG